MTDVTRIDLPEIAVIGKEGLCNREHNCVRELWNQANARFSEVAFLAARKQDGSFKGCWGAMSDEKRRFLPWEDGFTRGLYLAGVEAAPEAEAPEGWVKWILPARSYLVCRVDMPRYSEIFSDVIQNVLPEKRLALCGAVCDFTDPATGENRLYFPVETAGKYGSPEGNTPGQIRRGN